MFRNNTLSAQQAAARLGVSKTKFHDLLKGRPDIQSVGFNPNLTRQRNQRWRLADVDSLGTVMNPSEVGMSPGVASA